MKTLLTNIAVENHPFFVGQINILHELNAVGGSIHELNAVENHPFFVGHGHGTKAMAMFAMWFITRGYKTRGPGVMSTLDECQPQTAVLFFIGGVPGTHSSHGVKITMTGGSTTRNSSVPVFLLIRG